MFKRRTVVLQNISRASNWRLPSKISGAGLLLAAFIAIQLCQVPISHAQKRGASGLPLPRFVSLKAKRVNMRVGPGRDYKVQWLYVRKGLPMEIIQEFGNWRKVRDPNGNDGWVLHSLLSGKRRAIVTPWDIQSKDNEKPLPTISMYAANSQNARTIAKIEAGTLANIDECHKDWCKLSLTKSTHSAQLAGYVKKSLLWGVYLNEKVEN